jgi:hypothetical protein
VTITPAMIGTVVPTVRALPVVSTRLPVPSGAQASRSRKAGKGTPVATSGSLVPAWSSGYCGSVEGECADAGNRCPGKIRNGSAAKHPVLYCGCFCHAPF